VALPDAGRQAAAESRPRGDERNEEQHSRKLCRENAEI